MVSAGGNRSPTVRSECLVIAAAVGVLLSGGVRAWAHAGTDELRREADAQVAEHPGDAQPRLARARVLQLAGEWDAALAELDAAAARGADPDEVSGAGALGLDKVVALLP